jgi:hypothetical protein
MLPSHTTDELNLVAHPVGKGDVYRELKVGVIFEAERGRERSELAPEVWVDTPKDNSMRYVARRTAKGDFDQLLYGLACQSGLQQAKQLVILGTHEK